MKNLQIHIQLIIVCSFLILYTQGIWTERINLWFKNLSFHHLATYTVHMGPYKIEYPLEWKIPKIIPNITTLKFLYSFGDLLGQWSKRSILLLFCSFDPLTTSRLASVLANSLSFPPGGQTVIFSLYQFAANFVNLCRLNFRFPSRRNSISRRV